MKVWQDWRDYRRFQKLPSRDRNIVFYSETHQDWHHLQPLIDFLIHPLGRTVCHVTSEPTVPLPRPPAAGLHTFRIRSSVLCTWLFQTLDCTIWKHGNNNTVGSPSPNTSKPTRTPPRTT